MSEKIKEIPTKEKMNLEIQLIINRRLYERNIIDRFTHEAVMNELLKAIKTAKKGND